MRICIFLPYMIYIMICINILISTFGSLPTCYNVRIRSPGMLRYLSSRSTLTLLQCLHDSYQMASDFDQRPGLKFLIQKVARADVAANMYKQVGCVNLWHTSLARVCYLKIKITMKMFFS